MLTVHDLACLRGDRLLFNNVGFELNPGGLLYVLGENGSGKSSLLRMLCGLLMPEVGIVSWGKKTIKEEAENYLSNLTYIGLENLAMSARAAGNEVSEGNALEALAAIGIERCANLPARVLSQGQKRRVTLAKLWLSEAKLWILDEPFAALDIASVNLLATRLSEHLASGGMAILTTHQDVAVNAQSTQTLRLSA
jgi:heme exporter protein A